MEYLKAAVELKALISESNKILLEQWNKNTVTNNMLLKNANHPIKKIRMDTFSNDFVEATLASNTNTDAFIITDLVTMPVQEQPLTYILYKAYHKNIEKGLVCYQVIDKKTYTPNGPIQFSNLEDNIFFNAPAPEAEESNCNALETGEQTIKRKKIAFLIGHTHEERLLHDVQRLIFDTANNVSKNNTVNFHFIIQISKYGTAASEGFIKKVNEIDAFVKDAIKPIYNNLAFEFDIDQI